MCKCTPVALFWFINTTLYEIVAVWLCLSYINPQSPLKASQTLHELHKKLPKACPGPTRSFLYCTLGFFQMHPIWYLESFSSASYPIPKSLPKPYLYQTISQTLPIVGPGRFPYISQRSPIVFLSSAGWEGFGKYWGRLLYHSECSAMSLDSWCWIICLSTDGA